MTVRKARSFWPALIGLCLMLPWAAVASAVPALNEAAYLRLFLDKQDMPPELRQEQDARSEGASSDDQPFRDQHGQQAGNNAWTAEPDSVIWQVMEFRWVFPDAASASRYHRDRLTHNSEGSPPLPQAPLVGEECQVFSGEPPKTAQASFRLHAYIYLFRVGRVVIKLFVAQGPALREKKLTLQQARDLAQRAATRAREVLAAKESTEPIAPKPEVVVQSGHVANVTAVLFSPDGRTLASAGADFLIKLWDLRTQRELRSLIGHRAYVMALAFSPDGKLLASGGADGSIRIFETQSGRQRVVLSGHQRPVSCLVFAPDGRGLVSGSYDGRIVVWDTRVGVPLGNLAAQPMNAPTALAFSRNGEWLAAGFLGGKEPVRLWRGLIGGTPEAKSVALSGTEGLGFIGALSFSADGSLLAVPVASVAQPATGSKKPKPDVRSAVHIIATAAGKELFQLAGQHAQFHPNGELVTYHEARGVEVFSAETGALRRTLAGTAGAGGPSAFQVSPDGTMLADRAGHVSLWDYSRGKRVQLAPSRALPPFTGNMMRAMTLATSPTEPIVAAGGRDGQVRLWDLRRVSGPQVLEGPAALVTALAFSPDGKLLASGCTEPPINMRPQQVGGNMIAAGSGPGPGMVRIYSLAGPRLLKTFRADGIAGLAFSQDGKKIAGAGADVTIWEVSSGRTVGRLDACSKAPCSSLAFSDNGGVLFALGQRGSLSIWDLESKKELARIPVSEIVSTTDNQFFLSESLALQPRENLLAISTGRHFLAGTDDIGPIFLLNLRDPGKLPLLRGHRGLTRAVAFARQGDLLASGGGDGDVKLWDLKSSQELASFSGAGADVSSVAFLFDGRLLASAGSEEAVRLWDVEKRAAAGMLIALSADGFVRVNASGAYSASRDGLRDVAFRLGQRAFPFEQFDLQLNRPDRVLAELGYASAAQIATYRQLFQQRRRRLEMNEQAVDFSLPELTLVSPAPAPFHDDSPLRLRVKASDAHANLERIMVYVNDVPLQGKQGSDLRGLKSRSIEQEVVVPLSAGRNKIQLSVIDALGNESLRETMITTVDKPLRRNLYLLTIGVSDYQDATLRLQYAAKDARDIAALFQRENKSFAQVKVQEILDRDVTRENVLAARGFLSQGTIDDVVVVFLSGHGLIDAKYGYYFATADFDVDDPEKRGLRFEDLEHLVDAIPARQKLLLIDSCQAGEPVEPLSDAAPLQPGVRALPSNAKAIHRLSRPEPNTARDLLSALFADLRRGSGTTVIASASAVEYAFEAKTWQNSVFTYSLLEGLGSQKTDSNGDGAISVSELQRYVARRVLELTGGVQRPAFRHENLENDFVLFQQRRAANRR